jgi:immune inhibitor A
MRKKWLVPLAGTIALALSPLAMGPASADAGPAPGSGGSDAATQHTDNLDHPLGLKQAGLRAAGKQMQLEGKVGKNAKVAKVANGQYVELAREGEDSVFTVLGEFGTLESPFGILQGGTPGPLHNQIPEPDRSVDNSTIWAPDFTPAYYEDMLFSDASGEVSMRNFYKEQSSNRYTVNGDVTDWVQVPYRAAHYGRNWCGNIVCGQTTWWFVRDSINAWYSSRLAAGMTPAEIDDYLSQFDVWDRYDHDQDGNFNEPDGYIDHFQAVHAGEGEETGGGAQGTDAIWSHRWYVQLTPIGGGGPTLDDGSTVPYGGVRLGNSKYWIGDYTVEPENGGVGVFAHEFGHDLGLPDLYDTSGNVGGAENSTGFWTLYSSGSYGSTGKPEDGIGSKPIPMSAYEKIFLGWSNLTVVGYGQRAAVKLGPASANTKQTQQLAVLLPDKETESTVGTPYSGSYFYHSGSGNNLDNSMTREVALPAGPVSLSAKVRYSIEADWDYAYLTVDGSPVATSRSTASNPNGQNFGNGITGSTGSAWVDLEADLSAYAGQTVTLGFRYWTDGAVVGSGLSVDDLAITGQALDDAETDPGWVYDGFFRTSGSVTTSHFNAYFAEYRTYRGYDDGLRTGPYNFGFTNNPDLGNWVEHFPYQDGLLVWYYDTSFTDNNVGANCAAGRCGGLYLPVDAHPDLLLRPDNGQVWRPRIQSYDSTFGLETTDEVCLHMNSVGECYGGLPANPVFDDTQSYWVGPDASIGNQGWSSVPLPSTGTTIRVASTSAQNSFMQVLVNR